MGGLKFLALGLPADLDSENVVLQGYPYESFQSIFRFIRGNGSVLARLRERQEELVLCCNDAVRTQIGWTLRDILHSIETLIFEKDFKSINDFISCSQHISQSVDDIDRVATKLLHNQEKESVENVLIDPRNMGIVQPVTRMLRVIMSPILSSLHNWLFQGDYGGVLKDSIFKDSIYGLKRDRSFWTKLYTIRSDGVISPLLIQRIDVILLVGRSMNLLKAINSSHPLFQIETPRELDLVNYSRQSIELWESDLERWKTHVSVEQDELEEKFFSDQG